LHKAQDKESQFRIAKRPNHKLDHRINLQHKEQLRPNQTDSRSNRSQSGAQSKTSGQSAQGIQDKKRQIGLNLKKICKKRVAEEKARRARLSALKPGKTSTPNISNKSSTTAKFR